MRKIRIVQIGLGHDHACPIFDSLLNNTDVFEVVGFAVPESEEKDFEDKVKIYRDEKKVPMFTVEEALSIEGLDGAVIETEEINLVKYAQMAALKGLHIHMDKPGGINLAEFEELVSTVKEKNLTFSLGYMYRFNPKIIEAKEKIKRGDLGEIYSVEAHMDCEHIKEKRQWLEAFPGGMMFFLGCHLVDLIYSIQGEPDKVIPMSTSTNSGGVTAKDYGFAVFEYPNGISFTKTCAHECGGFMRRQLVIAGTKGTIEIKPIEYLAEDGKNWLCNMREVGESEGWDVPGKLTTSELYPRYDGMLINFAKIVCGEKENEFTYDYELSLYKLLLKACGEEN